MGHRLAAEIAARYAPPRISLLTICRENEISITRVWESPITAWRVGRRIFYCYANDDFTTLWAIAHEIAHILLEHPAPRTSDEERWQDLMADNFADDILVPPEWLKNHINLASLKDLAELYRVEAGWLKAKAARLGLYAKGGCTKGPACCPCPLEEKNAGIPENNRCLSEGTEKLYQKPCPRLILCNALERCLLPQGTRPQYFRMGKPLPCGMEYRMGRLSSWSPAHDSTILVPDELPGSPASV